MARQVFIGLIYCLATLSAAAQSNIRYFEIIDDDSVKLYVESFSILSVGHTRFTNKECARGFRLARITDGKFTGKFNDYLQIDDRDDPILMVEGRYREGNKVGAFVFNYPDGKMMAMGNYEMNQPVGDWKFYSPEGVMTMILGFDGGPEPLIQYMFDTQSQMVMVKDGSGEARFQSEGDVPYAVSGRVRNGRPEGEWIGEFDLYKEGNERTRWIRKETYQDGRMVEGKKIQSGRITDVCCTPALIRIFPTPAIMDLVSLEAFPIAPCSEPLGIPSVDPPAKRRTVQPVSSLTMFQSSVNAAIRSKYQGGQVGETYNPVGINYEENQLVIRFDTDDRGKPIHIKMVSAYGREFFLPVKRALQSQTTWQPEQTRLLLTVFIRMYVSNYSYRISFTLD